MSAPVNVKLKNPTERIEGWDKEAQQWLAINQDAKGNPNFYPLTIKAAYVVGVIHTICESVSILLKEPNAKVTTYLPAYGVFASAIELLGRCVRGNATTKKNSTKDLTTGFKWIASSFFEPYKADYESVPTNVVLIQTSKYMYQISNLVALRHLAAHGQAASRNIKDRHYEFGYIDYEILAQFPHLVASGLEKYWHELQRDENLCNRLAKAKIIALRKWPVFLSWTLFEANSFGVYHSIEEIFNRFDWAVRDS